RHSISFTQRCSATSSVYWGRWTLWVPCCQQQLVSKWMPSNTLIAATRITTMTTTTAPSPDYTKAIDLDPKFAHAYNNRGNAYDAKGDHDRPFADYNKAIDLDPKFAIAYYNRGVAYTAKGDHDRAIADYSRAIDLDLKYATAYNNRGRAYEA